MDELQINLNRDEAIVLFEFLSRFSETAKLGRSKSFVESTCGFGNKVN
jgi:hypothetical protein